MVSAASPYRDHADIQAATEPHRERVDIEVTDESFVCPTGGGFERVEWSVQVNNGWTLAARLAFGRAVGGVSAAFADSDDPYRAAAQMWGNRPAQVYYRRNMHLRAPIGTRFRRHVSTPVRDPVRNYYETSTDEYELRREGLVPCRVLAARAERRARQAGERPLTRLSAADTSRHGALVNAALEAGAAKLRSP